MRSGLWLPLFEELADPGVVARLAAEAEERGWHGVFVWDQLRWREPIRQVADPWITLTAIATATEHVRLGPMVTPLARRRPAKVAKGNRHAGPCSAVAGSSSGRSGQRPVRRAEFSKTGRSSMIARAARCSTKPSRSSWPPGPASPSPITEITTLSTTCSSCLGRCTCRGVPGVGRRLPRKRQAAAPRRTLRRLLPGRPRERGSVRRGGRGRARPARRQLGALRHRRRAASRAAMSPPYAEAGATWWMTAIGPGARWTRCEV